MQDRFGRVALNWLVPSIQYLLHKKQARKGFRTKAPDWDFIEFKIQMTGEFFKNFDQNSG